MNRYRPLIKFLSTTLIVGVLSVFFFAPKANALSIQEPTIFNGSFSKQNEVDAIRNLVSKKSEVVQVETKTVAEVTSKKQSLSEEVQQLRTQVADLGDMFVHINKYAPDSAGNSYAPGNCTWFVKSMRPDIGNFWGNANTWYSSAKAQGWNVGNLPKKGAVATTTNGWAGHVAYVTGVSLDRQWVTIKEMNFGGLYNMNTRTVYYTEFNYIYELD